MWSAHDHTRTHTTIMTSHAAKLRSFVTFAIDKLDVAAEGLQDDTPEEDYAELLLWCAGMARNLRSVGAAAPHELKSAIMTGLASVWDIRTDRPGPDLSVSALRDALSALLSTVLAAEDEAPEPSEEDVAPANLASMSLQDAVTYMWEVLDKAHRIEYADSGFTLNLQSKASAAAAHCVLALSCAAPARGDHRANPPADSPYRSSPQAVR